MADKKLKESYVGYTRKELTRFILGLSTIKTEILDKCTLVELFNYAKRLEEKAGKEDARMENADILKN